MLFSCLNACQSKDYKHHPYTGASSINTASLLRRAIVRLKTPSSPTDTRPISSTSFARPAPTQIVAHLEGAPRTLLILHCIFLMALKMVVAAGSVNANRFCASKRSKNIFTDQNPPPCLCAHPLDTKFSPNYNEISIENLIQAKYRRNER